MRGLVVLATVVGACWSLPGPVAHTLPFHARREAASVRLGDSIQEFALDLSSEIRDKGTVVFSPLSISSLLSVLLLGSSGVPYHELYTALHLPTGTSDASIHRLFKELLDSITQANQGVTLNVASGLFLQAGVGILHHFSASAVRNYGSVVRKYDFRRNAFQATKAINEWVKNTTEGLIPQLLTDTLSSQTVFVAANTVFFNGTWENPFIPEFTTSRSFHTGTKTVQVPMMQSSMKVPYIDIVDLDAHMIALPYKGGRFAMFILMSHGPASANLEDIEFSLYADIINKYIANMTNEDIIVLLPRMRLSYKTSLKSTLQNLFVNAIFDRTRADFSRLTASEDVWVDDVVHETVIEITETGTTAAAASSASFDRAGNPKKFVVDRPAVFFIRDLRSGLPLFWGRLVKPGALG